MSKKSRFFSIFSLIMILALLILVPILFVGCGKKTEITDISFTEEEYHISRNGFKYIDVNITPSNINLTGRLMWTSADPVIARVDGFGKVEGLNNGRTTITCKVVDSDLSASCDVIVDDGNVIYMEVGRKVIEDLYYEGDILDVSGLKVSIKYESGLSEDIPVDQLTLTYPTPLVEGAVLTIEYMQFKKEFELFVLPLEISKIELESLPTKTTYYAGEIFDPTGMVIEATYTNGNKRVIDYSNLQYKTTPLTIDDTILTITYQDFTVELPITIQSNYTVSDYSNLQSVIDSAVNNSVIRLANGTFNTSIVINIPLSKNLTILSLKNTTINSNSNDIIFNLIDDSEESGSLRLINLTLNTTSCAVSGDNLSNFTINLENTIINQENLESDIISITNSQNGNINFVNSNIINDEFIILENCEDVIVKFD